MNDLRKIQSIIMNFKIDSRIIHDSYENKASSFQLNDATSSSSSSFLGVGILATKPNTCKSLQPRDENFGLLDTQINVYTASQQLV